MAAGDTPITVVGNLVADPELRFTPSGQPVATFRVASTPRIRDNATNEWKDGDSLFLTCNVWRQAAENVAESLQRGMRVIVTGRLKQRNYETKEGEKRTVYEVEVDDVGPSLRNASAKVNRASRGGGEGGFGRRRQPGGGSRRRSQAAQRPARVVRRRQQERGPVGVRRAATPTNRRSNKYRRITTIPASRGALLRSTTMAKPPIRKPKKKVCVFCQERIAYVDYKDTGLLRKYISDRGKIRARRVTGNCTRHQRDVATAIKNAREMALLPYTSTAR